MPKKVCKYNGCRNKIKLNEVYCEEHREKERVNHKAYKEKRSDLFEQRFYKRKSWVLIRDIVKSRDLGLCQVCLDNKKIKKSDVVHHIIELKESRELGLETSNLLSLCNSCHQEIHAKYRKGIVTKKETQKRLKEIITRSRGD